MSVTYIPENLKLEITVKKHRFENKEPHFLSCHGGFRREYDGFLESIGLDVVSNSLMNDSGFFDHEFNGLLLPTNYIDYYLNQFGKAAIESGVLRDIPVLYSYNNVYYKGEPTTNDNLRKVMDYLCNHFDNVYLLKTHIKILGNPKSIGEVILADKDVKQELIHDLKEHPIEQWKQKMSETNRIKLEFLN